MTEAEIKKLIDSLSRDIDFNYNGKSGSINPFSREDISLCYDGNEKTVSSIDEALHTPFINGYSLHQIFHKLTF